MADFREIPSPTYDYQINRLVGYYKNALLEIDIKLKKIDLTDLQRATAFAVQQDIANILKELDSNATAWVEEHMPLAVSDGIVRSIVALGVVESIEEARTIVKFNRLNRDLVKTAIADTQDDLLQVSENVSRKVRTAIRQVTAEVLRTNLTQGINSTAALKRDIVRDLRKQLGDSLNTGIIDAAGRRWKPQVYVEMLVKTKMAAAHREATVNEGVDRGVLYGVISQHGAKDMCRVWEGKVISLVPNTPGDYPYIGSLPRRDIFHPNCRHVVTPVRRPDRLPDDLRQLNGI
ncbi:phage minor capsid protein [Cytobacillus firmus]|uniref:phage minor capsid protein n=1 Tax=Cytobacillus firmus TaxID=1399 RepID=UPI0018CE5261|nr:phage minor capsid protein [Cytobacillus firmus]MBG9548523.1 type IV secretion protein Rhs [Cytobacillus firmus]MBG9602946.1 type IV secretion protein Rhs [Cytobacillus firmus]MBG9654869.1 type IV secretion protein Rhs [Cytobacillus firmus]MED1906124.1 minor capsid protein [Cytobacillus firmus]MED1941539.1 minor capsid protein [Cytobacillus firmus]